MVQDCSNCSQFSHCSAYQSY